MKYRRREEQTRSGEKRREHVGEEGTESGMQKMIKMEDIGENRKEWKIEQSIEKTETKQRSLENCGKGRELERLQSGQKESKRHDTKNMKNNNEKTWQKKKEQQREDVEQDRMDKRRIFGLPKLAACVSVLSFSLSLNTTSGLAKRKQLGRIQSSLPCLWVCFRQKG